MNKSADVWFIRLPDGRVLRANSTAAVRHHLDLGDVPLSSRVRRSPLDSWMSLESVKEFADLAIFMVNRGRRALSVGAEDGNNSAGRTGMTLHAVGVSGLVSELMTSMESTLVRGKLRVAAVTGLALGLVLILSRVLPTFVQAPGTPWQLAFQGLFLLVVASWCIAVVTRMTYVELAHLRPARWSDVVAGLGRSMVRLAGAYLLVIGLLVLVLLLLRWLPGWLLSRHEQELSPDLGEGLAALVTFVRIVLEVVLWPMVSFALLLGPIVIVEECGPLAAVRQWLSLICKHQSRVLLYEALAVAVAAIAAVPFILPVEFAAISTPEGGYPGTAAQATLWLLRGLALTPAIAYLVVANVFIYLALRYEQNPAR
jgi:hypothetical protein